MTDTQITITDDSRNGEVIESWTVVDDVREPYDCEITVTYMEFPQDHVELPPWKLMGGVITDQRPNIDVKESYKQSALRNVDGLANFGSRARHESGNVVYDLHFTTDDVAHVRRVTTDAAKILDHLFEYYGVPSRVGEKRQFSPHP